MKLQTSATQVAQRTATLLRTQRGETEGKIVEPIWYRVVLSNPPTYQLLPRLRALEVQLEQDRYRYEKDKVDSRGFYVTRNKQKYSTGGKHLYRLPKLHNEEDRIRHLFYTNHPWELARPRNMVENNNPTPSTLDWSSIVQSRMQLSGESVVQRTLWLAKQPEYKQANGSDWFHAYEQARLEFYRLRMRQQAEAQIAQEEALMHGAVFGPSVWDSYVAREQNVVDKFTQEASALSKDIQAKRSQIVEEDDSSATTSA